MRALSDHLARVGVVGCGRPLLEGSSFLALLSSPLSFHRDTEQDLDSLDPDAHAPLQSEAGVPVGEST